VHQDNVWGVVLKPGCQIAFSHPAIQDFIGFPAPVTFMIRIETLALDGVGSRLPGQIMVITVAGSISAALAWMSYHSFEKPFLTLKRAFRTRPAAAEIEAREGKAPARRSR